MNTITNHYYPQQVQPASKKYESNLNDGDEKKFSDILELQSSSNNNQLEVYNYSVQELEDNKVEVVSNGKTDHKVRFVFPPESAPEGVKKAYESLSESEARLLSPGKILLKIRQMTPGGFDILLRRINGEYISSEEATKQTLEMYNDFFSQENFSYMDFTDKMISSWEQNKSYNSAEVYYSNLKMLEKFKMALLENGVR